MALLSRASCQERLGHIFPESLPQRGRLTNQLAASGVFVCLYVGAVGGNRWIRPSMVLWMCDEAAARTEEERRDEWYVAARSGKRQLAELAEGWGFQLASGTRTTHASRFETRRCVPGRSWGRRCETRQCLQPLRSLSGH